ncbi:MAG: AarF/ABC1/UbiB kinase family protein [Elusimicrobiota bacterium]
MALISISNGERLGEIVGISQKHGLGYYILKLGLEKYAPWVNIGQKEVLSIKVLAEKVRLVLSDLGPTFVKFGQILSTRPDLLPEEFIQEFRKLQDELPAVEYDVIEPHLKAACGYEMSEIFLSISHEPIAAASIAQVHDAVLINGQKVVLKIQRPGIADTIKKDLDILYHLARLIERFPDARLYQPRHIVDEFARNIQRELNFLAEAQNAERMAQNFKDVKEVHIPKIYWDYTCGTVLVMEKVEGIKVDDLDTLISAGYDLKKIARTGADAIIQQVFIDGFFHGDPHPGNICVLPGGVVCFMDFGIVGRVTLEHKEELAELIVAIVNKDTNKIVNWFSSMEMLDEVVPLSRFKRDIYELLDEYYNLPLKKIVFSQVVNELTGIISRYSIKIRLEYTLLIKSLVAIEGIGMRLDPEFDIIAYISPVIQKVIAQQWTVSRLKREVQKVVSELLLLFRVLPGETREILRKIKLGKLRIEFEHQGLDELISTVDKVSNRISISLMTSAILIASALIIQTKYSAYGLVMFIVGCVVGILLILQILVSKKF